MIKSWCATTASWWWSLFGRNRVGNRTRKITSFVEDLDESTHDKLKYGGYLVWIGNVYRESIYAATEIKDNENITCKEFGFTIFPSLDNLILLTLDVYNPHMNGYLDEYPLFITDMAENIIWQYDIGIKEYLSIVPAQEDHIRYISRVGKMVKYV
jgi:hypothetical protein